MYAGVFSRVESGDGGSAGSFHHSLCRICDDKADEHVESAEGERVYSGGDFDTLWGRLSMTRHFFPDWKACRAKTAPKRPAPTIK